MAAIYPGVGIELHSPVRTLARECYLPRNTADTIDVGCDPRASPQRVDHLDREV